MVVQTQAKT